MTEGVAEAVDFGGNGRKEGRGFEVLGSESFELLVKEPLPALLAVRRCSLGGVSDGDDVSIGIGSC